MKNPTPPLSIRPMRHLAAVLLLALGVSASATEPLVLEIPSSVTTGPVVSRMLYGMNVARWDHSLYPSRSTTASLAGFPDRDRKAIALLADCRPSFLKYPGGNDADSYIWNSSSAPAADMDTTEFIHLASECDALGFLTVNFAQPPELAADWVRSFGSQAERFPFWEVGDEVWGAWTKTHMPGEAYGRRFREFSRAMKAINPRIRLAANLGLASPEAAWTREALRSLGDSYDVVTMTYFPLFPPDETDQELFAAAGQYRQLFRRLEEAVTRARGGQRPAFCLVGFNSTATNPGPQSVSMANAIFMAQMYAALAETGTDMAAWWAFHNANPSRGGDYGILTADGRNAPHYTYWVYRELSRSFHGRLLGAKQEGEVELYAVRQDPEAAEEGAVVVLAINRSRNPSGPVEISLPGERKQSGSLVWIDSSARERGGPASSSLELQSWPAAGRSRAELGSLPPQSVSILRIP